MEDTNVSRCGSPLKAPLAKRAFLPLTVLLLACSLCFGLAPAQAYAASSSKSSQTLTTAALSTAKPAKVKVKSVKASKNTITVKYNAVKGAKKYQVAYRTKSAKKWTAKNAGTKRSFKISGLKYNTAYQVMVRAYNGKKWGAWSAVKTIKTRPLLDFSMTEKEFVATWGKKIDRFTSTYVCQPSMCQAWRQPLYGHGKTIAKYSYKYGLDPRIVVAIACAETGYGWCGTYGCPYNYWSWSAGIYANSVDGAIEEYCWKSSARYAGQDMEGYIALGYGGGWAENNYIRTYWPPVINGISNA